MPLYAPSTRAAGSSTDSHGLMTLAFRWLDLWNWSRSIFLLVGVFVSAGLGLFGSAVLVFVYVRYFDVKKSSKVHYTLYFGGSVTFMNDRSLPHSARFEVTRNSVISSFLEVS
jgi:hypothetical protein